MDTKTMIALALVAVLALGAAYWYFFMRTQAFDPEDVEVFRIGGSPDEYVISSDSHPYNDGDAKKTEFIWKSTNGKMIMFRDSAGWTITYSVYLSGVIAGGDGGITRSNDVNKYPFLCDWQGKIVEVKLKGEDVWTPIKSLLSTTDSPTSAPTAKSPSVVVAPSAPTTITAP